MENVESGKDVCDGFFGELTKIKGLNPAVLAILKELYFDGKLVKEEILKELGEIREAEVRNE